MLDRALALHRAGSHAAALKLYGEAARAMPANHRLWMAEASAALDAGDLERGRRGLARALILFPGEGDGWVNASGIALRSGRKPDAEAAARRALVLVPAHPVAWNNLTRSLAGTGRVDALDRVSRHALTLQPGEPIALMARVLWASEAGRPAEAGGGAMRGLCVLPGDPTFLSNLGAARAALDDREAACLAYRRALCAGPAHAPAWYNLGNLLEHEALAEASIRAHDRAVLLAPANADYQFNHALVLLRAGRFDAGFAGLEHRWQSAAQTTAWRAPGRTLWDGRPLIGETVLAWAEQGLGDTLHFSRYLQFIRERGGVPHAEVQPELAALLRHAPAIAKIYARGLEDAGPAEFHIPMMSLARLARSTPERVPPPLSFRDLPDPRITGKARGVLDVGLVWAGNPKHRRDAERSIPLALLAPLAGRGDIRLHVVQHGEARRQIDTCGFGEHLIGHPETADFLEAAALVRGLDLLITVDTAQAHLAGTLGVETWLLLPQVPDWRWLTGREDCIWYPSVRLFRQDASRAWPPVIDRVAGALARRTGR
jgi:tetratricopeptide (TPR) repeat protein